jgi:hypothetical protein
LTGRDRELLDELIRGALALALFILCMVTVSVTRPQTPYPSPLGIVNSNPGNIRSNNWHWWKKHGAVGVDPWKHLIFATDQQGLAAIKFVLEGYRRKGFTTIEKITARWVGPSNSKKAMAGKYGYMMRLVQDTGLKPSDEIDMNDPETLATLAGAIVFAECGADPYTEEMYHKVFNY